jgi:flagellar biosynthesis protein FliR
MVDPFSAAGLVVAALFVRFFVAFRMVSLSDGASLPISAVGGLSAAIAVFSVSPVVSANLTVAMIPIVFIKELLVGMLLGMSVRLIFSVLQIAGGLTNLCAWKTEAPENGAYFGRLYFVVGAGLFLLMDGHHALTLAAMRAIDVIPPLGNIGVSDTVRRFLPLVTDIFVASFQFGVLVAMPVFVTVLLLEILAAFWIGLRIGRQTSIFSFARGYGAQAAAVLLLWKSTTILVDFLGNQTASLW